MAISIEYDTKIINIPQADLTPVGGSFYEMDINWFHLQLRDWEDDENGIFMPDTHEHSDPVDIGGVTIARVVRIINGYTITFEDGIYIVTMTGANSNILDVANLNSVSLRSANSAGLVATPELQYSSYEGAVWYNSGSGNTGTVYPNGTRREPVDNMADALTIAQQRGLGTIRLQTPVTLQSLDFTGFIFRGENPVDITVSVDPTANVTDCTFRDLTLSGTLDGDNQIYDCLVGNISGFNGIMRDCILYNAIITLGGAKLANIINCVSGAASPTKPVIDMGGTGQELALQNYTGSVQIENKTGTDDVAIDIRSGEITLTNTVDGGSVILRGVGLWENESTFAGTATVLNQLVTEADITSTLAQATSAAINALDAETAALQAAADALLAKAAAENAETAANQAITDIAALPAPDNTSINEIHKAHFNRRRWDKVADEVTVYDNNGTTPFKVFDTNDDLSELTPQ